MNTITSILSLYGFETRADGAQWWGTGSMVWGHIAEVRHLGRDLYEVTYHGWDYDCDGELVADERTTAVLHGARLLQFLFERLPFRYPR